jgi:hypothetical protein
LTLQTPAQLNIDKNELKGKGKGVQMAESKFNGSF